MILTLRISSFYGTFLAFAKGLATAVFLGLFFMASAQASPATDVIDDFHETLLETMKNAENWGFDKRREFLAGPVSKTFNAALMVRLASTSRFWDQFTPEQQTELAQTFEDFTLSNYASRFKGYSGQGFETLGEEPMRGKRVLVKTILINGEEDIHLDYVMYPDEDGSYRVIDVFQKGSVSELAIRKSEFSPVLRDQGFTGLITLLKRLVNNLRQEALNPS